MKKFKIIANSVDIVQNNGTIKKIFFNENSGKVYFRYKIDSITNIKHPGIFLGIDQYGTEYFLHNHYQIGTACLVNGNEFRKGMSTYLYQLEYTNPPLEIIKIGLMQAINKEPYSVLKYNCQDFVNIACNNKRKSEDVERIGKGVLFTFLILCGLNLISE